MDSAQASISHSSGEQEDAHARLFAYILARKSVVEEMLERFLPPVTQRPERLHEAMRYSVLNGGKRLRAVLCFAAAEAVKGQELQGDSLMPTACALEIMHCSSLICDDLPALDNSPLRRGVPTCHVEFGEATAILAQTSLIALTYSLLSRQAVLTPEVDTAALISLISDAGMRMVAGESEDLRLEGQRFELPDVEFIHDNKTGALIRVSLLAGAIVAGADAHQQERLVRYADALGLAFQIVDDLLDEEGDAAVLGKPVGADQARVKPTFVRLFGVQASRQLAIRKVEEALEAVQAFGERAEPLRWIARYVLARDR